MSNYFCPECGYESYDANERICPHCNQPMEELFVKDEPFEDKNEIYPAEVLEKIENEETDKLPITNDDNLGFED